MASGLIPRGGPRWTSPQEEYARNFRSDGTPKDVWYVDIPKGDQTEIDARGWDDTFGSGVPGLYINTEIPEHWAAKMRRVSDGVPEDKTIVEPGKATISTKESAYLAFLGIDQDMAERIGRE